MPLHRIVSAMYFDITMKVLNVSAIVRVTPSHQALHVQDFQSPLPSARKRGKPGDVSLFHFCSEKANESPQIFFCTCFRNEHVGHA